MLKFVCVLYLLLKKIIKVISILNMLKGCVLLCEFYVCLYFFYEVWVNVMFILKLNLEIMSCLLFYWRFDFIDYIIV